MHVYSLCLWYPQGSEEGIDSPETGVADGYEPLCGVPELNLDLLRESVPLITELSLSSPTYFVCLR